MIQVIIFYANDLLLYGIKYISEYKYFLDKIYLTQRWDPNRYYNLGQSGPSIVIAAKEEYTALLRSTE